MSSYRSRRDARRRVSEDVYAAVLNVYWVVMALDAKSAGNKGYCTSLCEMSSTNMKEYDVTIKIEPRTPVSLISRHPRI